MVFGKRRRGKLRVAFTSDARRDKHHRDPFVGARHGNPGLTIARPGSVGSLVYGVDTLRRSPVVVPVVVTHSDKHGEARTKRDGELGLPFSYAVTVVFVRAYVCVVKCVRA